MLHALLRKGRADILGSPLQTILVFLVVAAASATLTMALVSKQSAEDAYMSRLAETNGAHAWFFTPRGVSDPSYLTPIGRVDGVTATVGPLPVLWGPFPLVRGDEGVDLQLFGMPPELPAVGRPKVTGGRWLAPGGTEEIVIDHGLARELDIKVGDRVEVLKGDGSETFEVVGLAVIAARPSYPVSHSSTFFRDNNSFAFVLPETLTRMEPDTNSWSWRFGVRLQEPDDVGHFVRRARGMYPEGEKPF